MNASRDPDHLIRTFLMEGEELLQDPIYDEVRAAIEQKRQRTFIGPWRTPIMNRFVTVGLGAAAVVVIGLLLGAQLLGSPTNVGGPGGESTPTPEASVADPTATPEPSPSEAGGLPEGSHLLWEGDNGGVPVTVNIPASGWYGEPGIGFIEKGFNGSDPPDGSGMIVFTEDIYVYGDPCEWSTTRPDQPASTVDEAVAALSAQASRNATAPVDVTLGGYAGKSITLHVPDDADEAECDEGEFASWGVRTEDPARVHQGPGQIDELWILDVDGQLVIIDAAHYEQTPAEDVEELHAIVDSITFE
jgi:hypothetical protein